MTVGFWQIVIVALVVVLLFGRGKISELMGDVAKGIKSFKKGITEDAGESETANEKIIEHQADEPVAASKPASKTASKAKAKAG